MKNYHIYILLIPMKLLITILALLMSFILIPIAWINDDFRYSLDGLACNYFDNIKSLWILEN